MIIIIYLKKKTWWAKDRKSFEQASLMNVLVPSWALTEN